MEDVGHPHTTQAHCKNEEYKDRTRILGNRE